MRCGLLADRLDRGPRRTGIGAYIEGLAQGLGEIADDDRFVLFSLGSRADAAGSLRNGSAMTVGTLPWPRRATTLAWAVAGRPRIRDVGGRLDLLHVLVPTVPVPTAVPYVATVHDLIPLKHPQLFRRRDRALFGRAVRHMTRKARWVIAVSEATRRDVVELLGFPEERTAVVHHGVPVHFSAAPIGQQQSVRLEYGLGEDPVLLFVGEVAERKNVPRLIDAFADVVRKVPEARLVLAGSPGLGYDKVRQRVRAASAGSIVLLGHAPQHEVESLMSTASAVVIPSVDEGFGFPALEAMSIGTPVIAADTASLPEVVDGAGLLVSPLDRDAIAGAMHRVLTDVDLRRNLSTRGLERAATFTWRRAAEQTLEVYGNALRP
jgi:glycosyltransferase involved in cell wall biosynthesis